MNNKRLIKAVGYIIFTLLFIFLSIFGLGPVLLADGTAQERIMTFVLVVILYVVLILVLRWFKRRFS